MDSPDVCAKKETDLEEINKSLVKLSNAYGALFERLDSFTGRLKGFRVTPPNKCDKEEPRPSGVLYEIKDVIQHLRRISEDLDSSIAFLCNEIV